MPYVDHTHTTDHRLHQCSLGTVGAARPEGNTQRHGRTRHLSETSESLRGRQDKKPVRGSRPLLQRHDVMQPNCAV